MTEPMKHRSDLIGLFAHHKVAANLLMIIMIMSGAFALDRLNVQFFPNLRAGDRAGARGLERGQRRGHRGRHHQPAGAAAAHRR